MIKSLLTDLDVQLVLIDVGASGNLLVIWNDLAGISTFIRFDLDLRDVRDISEGRST